MEIFKIKSKPNEVWVGWFSSSIEAYNMAIYSFTAPLLSLHLFQSESKLNGIFSSYALLLIGSLLFYPLGALYYGLIGDRCGRQKICIYSTLGLSFATAIMGFVPFYSESPLPWISFLILICAQHFFSGGEYHGSIVFSLEHAEDISASQVIDEKYKQKGGFISALSCLFAVAGLCAANGLASLSILMQNQLCLRLCFIIGGVGGFICYYLKNYCRETPSFAMLSQNSLKELKWGHFLKEEWRKIWILISILAFFMTSYSFIFIFLPLTHLNTNAQIFNTFNSLIAYGLMLVLAGLLSEKIGIQKTMLLGVGLFSATAFWLCKWQHNLFLLQLSLMSSACLVIGPIHSWMMQQFKVQQRCRGIFVSSAIATSIFGGSAVPICLKIYALTPSLEVCSLYPLAIALNAFKSLLQNMRVKT